MPEKLKVLDLFSGIGGFSLGLERTGGFETVAFCEIDPFCQKVLKKHWPDVPVYDDVRTLDYDGSVDVICSGDPCQRDSRANRHRDGESMWKYTFSHIARLRPLYVVRENVFGNVETGTLERVESDLGSEGYKVRSYLIPAGAVGAAHDRYRTWTLAYSMRSGRKELHDAAIPGEKTQRKHTLSSGSDGIFWMGSEPPVLRRIDDVPYRVDRIKSLGNAVVPEIPEIIGNAILKAEYMK